MIGSMRNYFLTLCILKKPCIRLSIFRSKKVLQVVKMDGTTMEFKSPLMVKELLSKFEGFGVKSSRKSSKLLPPFLELQMGRIYHLHPIKPPDQPKTNHAADQSTSKADTAVKRIKVVITKKQLEELLSKKTSVEKIIFGIDKACSNSSGLNWKPALVSIPEEDELIEC